MSKLLPFGRIVACVFLSTTTLSFADDRLAIGHPLSEEQIQSALALGNDPSAELPSLILGSSGVRWGGTASDSNRGGHFFEGTINRGNRTSGFGVELLTPYSWLARVARDSYLKGREMDARHVGGNEPLLEPVLRILCYSDMPQEFSVDSYFNAVVSVSLRPTNKKLDKVALPVQETRIPDRYRMPDGESIDLGPLLASFALDDVLSVSSLDKKGEFYVTIVAEDGEKKEFKVKTKHFESLP